MKFLTYEFSDANESYPEITFGGTNLLVGSTGSGKSRFLQSMFRLGTFIASGSNGTQGSWKCRISLEGKIYAYSIQTEMSNNKATVKQECLEEEFGDSKNIVLLERDESKVRFEDRDLPSLTPNSSLLNLMQGEAKIAPLFKGFQTMRQRNFSGSDNEKMRSLVAVPPELLAHFQRTKNVFEPILAELPLGGVLFILKRCFPKIFTRILTVYKSIFPQVIDIEEIKSTSQQLSIIDPNLVMLGLKEKFTKDPIPLQNISSGMLKALLILVDINTQPEGSVYLIDEYENSLGVNAIDFLPDLLVEFQNSIQFFITSHHPYLINKIPVKNWYVFGRHGRSVGVKFGEELTERYGRSKQETFTQLINDPFYREGLV